MAGPQKSRIVLRVLMLLILVGIGFGMYRGVDTWLASQSIEPQRKHFLTHVVQRTPLTFSLKDQGTLESSENYEVICQVRGSNIITSVVENGTYVKKGDVLITLDSLFIDEQIAERSKYAHWSRSGAEHWLATVKSRELALAEYLEGRFVTEVLAKELELIVKESDLLAFNEFLTFNVRQFEKGYVSADEVERWRRRIDIHKVDLDVMKSDLSVLREHTKKSEMARLEGELKVAKAQFEASDERADADASRRDRALAEKEFCTIRAPKDGLVIHPKAASWKWAPDITEGGTVYKEQVLLLMPNLEKMQVKLGIVEAMIDSVTVGMKAIVTLPGRAPFEAKVSEVADIARPPIIGSGDVVRYDVIIELPKLDNLKPGTSAKIEIMINEVDEVLTVPLAATVEIEDDSYCWVETSVGAERRLLQTKPGDDVSLIVESGVRVGEKVVMNPLIYSEDAGADAPEPKADTENAETELPETTTLGLSGALSTGFPANLRG